MRDLPVVCAVSDDDSDPAALPELPPLDHDDEVSDLGDEAPDLNLPEDDTLDNDATESSIDLDIGLRIDEPLAEASGGEAHELVLDMNELLNMASDDPSADDDGPADLDLAVGLEAPPNDVADDAEEGVADSIEGLVAGELPAMDADEDGFFDDGPLEIGLGAADEPPPPLSPVPWELELVERAPAAPIADHFPKLEGFGAATAVGQGGTREVALLRSGAGWALARRASDGGWEHEALGNVAHALASGASPLLVAHDDMVALGDSMGGVAIRSSRDARWVPISGCAGVTALAAGDLDDRATVWLAVFHETADTGHVVLVDVASGKASRIADFVSPADVEEWGRAAALAWDPEARCLWAWGGFGAARLSPRHQ